MKASSIFDTIIAFAIKRKKVVFFLMVLTVILGVVTYNNMTKEVLPEMKFPYAGISIYYPGASPEDMEKLVTDKVEAAVSGVGDIKKVESSSSNGSSITTIRFEQGVDIPDKVNKIKGEIDAIRSELPKDIEAPIVEEYSENKSPILYYSLAGDISPDEMVEYTNLIKRTFKKISGVSKVEVFGITPKEIEVSIDPDKLSLYQLSESAIGDIISSKNIDMPSGSKVLNDRKYNIRVKNSFVSVEEIDNIIITEIDGKPIYVKDIADVFYKRADEVNYALLPVNFKEANETYKKTVSVNVYKKQGVDVVKVSDAVKEALVKLQETKLPKHLTFELELDMSSFVKDSISDVFGNAFSGLLVVVVVLFFFIDFRESIIVSLVIPFSLLIAISVFKVFNVTINILSILGLIVSLGMLVDNAIVVVESIQVIKKKYDNMKDVAMHATSVVASAIFSSTLTTVCAFVPLALLKGDIGVMLKPIPISVVLTLVASLLLSLSVTPMISATFMSLKKKMISKPMKWFYVVLVAVLSIFAFMNKGSVTTLSFIGAAVAALAIWFKLFKLEGELHETKFIHNYKRVMTSILKSPLKRWGIIILSVILFVSATGLLMSDAVKKNAMPSSDTRYFDISMSLPAGATIDQSRLAIEQTKEIFHKDYIESYSVNLHERGATIFIRLLDKKERDLHSKQITTNLLSELKAIPHASFSSEDSGAGSSNLVLRLSSSDRQALTQTVKDIKEALKASSIVRYTYSPSSYGSPELQIVFDHQQAAMLKLNTLQMANDIRQVIRGKKLTTIKENGQEIKVMLRNSELKVDEISDLEGMYFTNSLGAKIPFTQVASIKETRGPSSIKHVDSDRIADIAIGADKNVAISTLVSDVDAILAQTAINEKVSVGYTGSYEDMQESNKDLMNKLLIAIVLIFLVLLVQFDSFIQSFVVILAVPMGVVGVAFGYYAFGITFGILSLLGVVSLAGIAVNDSIVLIDTVNQLRKFDKMDRLASIVEAGYSRFIPVLATSITTIAGVLPLALYNEDYSQIAWTIIFGLIASTLLILVLVPIMLDQLERFTKKGRAHEVK